MSVLEDLEQAAGWAFRKLSGRPMNPSVGTEDGAGMLFERGPDRDGYPYDIEQSPVCWFRGVEREEIVRARDLPAFLRRYPHPFPKRPATEMSEQLARARCEKNERDQRYDAGGSVCPFCRDRLTLTSTVIESGAPLVRVRPKT